MADPPPDRARTAHVSLETTEPMPFGHGFISGLLSAILGIAGLGAVLCLHFPQYLTHPELRRLYVLDYLRAIIHLTLVASFLLGSVSAFLRANKTLALIGIGSTLVAALLGGSTVPVNGEVALVRGWGSISSSSTCCSIRRSSFRSNGYSRSGPASPSSAANGWSI